MVWIGMLVGVSMHGDVIYQMTFNYHKHAEMFSAYRRIFVKTKWLCSWASKLCSLALKVQALNAQALTPDGGKDLCMR